MDPWFSQCLNTMYRSEVITHTYPPFEGKSYNSLRGTPTCVPGNLLRGIKYSAYRHQECHICDPKEPTISLQSKKKHSRRVIASILWTDLRALCRAFHTTTSQTSELRKTSKLEYVNFGQESLRFTDSF